MLALFLISLPALALADTAGTGAGNGSGSGGVGGGGLGGIIVVSSSAPATTAQPPAGPVVTSPGSPTTTDPDQWVVMTCTWCLAQGIACSPSGSLANIAPGGPLPDGDSLPLIEYLQGPVGDATPSLPFCSPDAVTTTVPPPPPPSADAVWAAAPLPLAEIELDPSAEGIVQLPTWFWLGNDTAGQAFTLGPINLDGYSLTVTATPVRYIWTFGDGQNATTASSGGPGGASLAAVTHTYSEKGTYNVGVSVVWQGLTTFTYEGKVVSETDLGQYTQSASIKPYEVEEVRALLVGG